MPHPQSHRLTALATGLLFLAPACDTPTSSSLAWPAEPERQAANLSETNRAFLDGLSGAVWNPIQRRLWVCSNGPGEASRLWSVEPDGTGGLRTLGEWKGIGDAEAVTFANFGESVVYMLLEGRELIYELDVSIPGKPIKNQVYDTSSFLPGEETRGAEGLTFVPDEYLTKGLFVDAEGAARVSRNGMGGLMVVGHENGGGLFFFDLERDSGRVDFVGEYRVGAPSNVVALEFDRSSERMFAWHGRQGRNALSVSPLASKPVPGAKHRRLHGARIFGGPSNRNYEGLALVPTDDCGPTGRSLYLSIDDGGTHSLFRYRSFELGCGL